MKQILVTGKTSYVGVSFGNWLSLFPDKYEVDFISLRNEDWKLKDFSKYDAILHVAGIAHIKETPENSKKYYEINRDLAYEVAKKAKVQGVGHFIFLSSMSVYGLEAGIIDENSSPNPKSDYGKSKFEAEKLISSLNNDWYKVTILRPPMIYGKGCKGNYNKLAKLALLSPFFPYINNKRSMIYIDNLSEFTRHIVDNRHEGLFFPQNDDYVNPSEMVRLISKIHGKKIYLLKIFNPLIYLMKNQSSVKKVFGNLVYKKTLSNYDSMKKDNFIDFEDSVKLTEDY